MRSPPARQDGHKRCLVLHAASWQGDALRMRGRWERNGKVGVWTRLLMRWQIADYRPDMLRSVEVWLAKNPSLQLSLHASPPSFPLPSPLPTSLPPRPSPSCLPSLPPDLHTCGLVLSGATSRKWVAWEWVHVSPCTEIRRVTGILKYLEMLHHRASPSSLCGPFLCPARRTTSGRWATLVPAARALRSTLTGWAAEMRAPW